MNSLFSDKFVIDRALRAPTDRVFAAWAEPETRAKWFIGPPEWVQIERRLDFRFGEIEMLRGKIRDMVTLFEAV